MESQWNIEYYIPPTGGPSPLARFIDDLPEKVQGKLSNTFALLQEFGLQVRAPHVKKVTDTPLWELRILGQDNIRFFYIVPRKETFLLLHGFVKKKHKTPRKEIETALVRLKEYQARTKE